MKIDKEEFFEWIQKELSLKNPPKGNVAFREISTWSSLNALLIMTHAFEKWKVLLTAQQLAEATTLDHIWELLNVE